MKIAIGPRRKWWYMLVAAVFLPSIIAVLFYQIALMIPGTVKQTWFDNFYTAMLLTTPLLALYVLSKAKSYTVVRAIASTLAVVFFLLVAMATQFSMPCGELPEYIGQDSTHSDSGECE